ncbi:MAG: hypothetical protein HYU43_09670, partial [Armatimonadetes bacterium]|nr:hypothetical protein [Armatimonadota bacterium]
TATTVLNADSSADGSDTNIDSIGALPIGLVTAGVGDVNLTSSAAMTDTNGALNNVTATNLTLSAVSGIGLSTDLLDTTVSGLEAETDTGGIHVSNTGDLSIGGVTGLLGGAVVNTSGDITLINAGDVSIVDTVDNDLVDVDGGTGSVTIQANGATSDILTGNGDTAIETVSGDINLSAGQDILLGDSTADEFGDVLSGGNLNLTAGRDLILDDDTFAHSNESGLGGNIVANAVNDIILTDTNSAGAEFQAHGDGSVTLNAGGDVTMTAGSNGVETDGAGAITMTANGSVVLDSAVTGGGNVTITATTGSITDANAGSNNVTAPVIDLNAATGVGVADAL